MDVACLAAHILVAAPASKLLYHFLTHCDLWCFLTEWWVLVAKWSWLRKFGDLVSL
jgi:hypothetical protein